MKLSRALFRSMALAVALSSVAFGGPGRARADLAPGLDFLDPCEGKAVGTPCDNSEGLCQNVQNGRGTQMQCVHDSHQCDRLGVGVLCRETPPSHCVRFTGDHGDSWIACQDDALEAARRAEAAPPASAPAATPPPPPTPPAPAHDPEPNACSVALEPAASTTVVALVLLLAFALTARRQRSRTSRVGRR